MCSTSPRSIRWPRIAPLPAALAAWAAAIIPCAAAPRGGESLDAPLTPGSGVKVTAVGDDFEAPDWHYALNGPNASHELDGQTRPPGGRSRNGRWYEGAKRGHPDVVRRIPTPPGGPEGSRGALLLATKHSGIPGDVSGKQQQDDLLMNVQGRLGGPVPVAWQPSCIVRVYLPDFDRWEPRSGASLGVRVDLRGRNAEGALEPYWPGMFLLFRSGQSRRFDHDFAEIQIRAEDNGRDATGPLIETPGWWTFGISITPDGRVHQYAKAGLDDLGPEDHLFSSLPYGMRCVYFDNFFVNVANLENGSNWSTPWAIDDAEFFVVPPRGRTVKDLLQRGESASRGTSGPSRAAALSRTLRR
jgi:hypothetical protein